MIFGAANAKSKPIDNVLWSALGVDALNYQKPMNFMQTQHQYYSKILQQQ
jgi:hypothetical protein